jgi:DNA-binding transcriptional ArsR family regulator
MDLLLERLLSGLGMARTPDPRTPEHALRSSTRRGIVEVLHQDGPLAVSALRLRVGLGWGAFYHQLQRLEDVGIVRLHRVGRRTIAHLASADRPLDELKARAVLASASARRVAATLGGSPLGVSTEKLAGQCAISPRTLSYHAHRFEKAGLLEREPRGRAVLLRPTPLLLRVLRSLERP